MQTFKRYLITLVIPFLVAACGGGGGGSSDSATQPDPVPLPVTVDKTPAEGIWDGSFTRFFILEDNVDPMFEAYPLIIPSTSAAELMITPDGQLFLRDDNNNTTVAYGTIQLVSGDDQLAEYEGELYFVADRQNYKPVPASATVKITVSNSREMTMTVSFLNAPNNVVTIQAEYNDAKYANKPDFSAIARQYTMTTGIWGLSWNSGINTVGVQSDGAFWGLGEDHGSSWSGQLTVPYADKNLYTFQEAHYSRPGQAEDFTSGIAYLSGDKLIIFSSQTPSTPIYQGNTYKVHELAPIPFKPEGKTNQPIYEGQWDFTLAEDPSGQNAGLKRRLIVLENGEAILLGECMISYGFLSPVAGSTTGRWQFKFSGRPMFNDGTACPTSPGIYPYQVDYLESEIDTVTGIMTFNETITRNGEATSVTWRGENNNAQYDVAPAPVAGTYVDLEYSNTVTVDNNGQFTYVLTGSPSSDYFSATLTAAKDKNYYTINGGYSIFGTDISGYAIPTDFYGDTRLVVNFFGDQIQGDSLPPLKSGLSRVWTPLQQE